MLGFGFQSSRCLCLSFVSHVMSLNSKFFLLHVFSILVKIRWEAQWKKISCQLQVMIQLTAETDTFILVVQSTEDFESMP